MEIERGNNFITLDDSITKLDYTNNNNILNSLKPKNGSLNSHEKTTKIRNISNLILNDNEVFNNNIKNNENTKSIQVEKNIINYGEPKTKIHDFKKLSPKFIISIGTQNLLLDNYNEDNDNYHQITTSDVEMMKIDEKLPQKNLDEIESKRYEIEITNTFPFHFFIQKEKCYENLLKDLKGNKNKNIDYKTKIASTYLNILLNPKFPFSNIGLNDKNINKFLVYESCLFLLVLFLKDLSEELNENDISDFLTCASYCHLNFLFLLLLLVNKTNKDVYKNAKNINGKNPEIDYSYDNFQKCRILIELNAEKVDIIKYQLHFNGQNKIIKNILINILTNLSSNKNQSIINKIHLILNLSKKNSLKTIINNYIGNSQIIIGKMQTIINEIISPENLPNDDNYDLNLDKRFEEKGGKDINNQQVFITPLVPFLPNKSLEDKRDYCLILDLDETLVHYCEEENNAFVKVRYGTENFIKKLNKFCEIVIFTASKKKYADVVIDGLGVKEYIDYKLYREHTTPISGYNVKDLSKLGRPLNKIIIIDNIEKNYQLQPNNGLNIINFEGEENDLELDFLLKDLLPIVEKPGKDICKELGKVRKSMQKRYTNIY